MSRNLYELMKAANVDMDGAITILRNLEEAGLTIYKRKVHQNDRRPNSSRPMSKALEQEIRDFYLKNPTFTQSQIAAIYNVNIGRVAEAIRHI